MVVLQALFRIQHARDVETLEVKNSRLKNCQTKHVRVSKCAKIRGHNRYNSGSSRRSADENIPVHHSREEYETVQREPPRPHQAPNQAAVRSKIDLTTDGFAKVFGFLKYYWESIASKYSRPLVKHADTKIL